MNPDGLKAIVTASVRISLFLVTVGLWGRTSNLLVELPYAWGTTKGLLAEAPASRDFSDFGDLRITLNVNLRGAPSMTLEDFLALRANPHLIIGASLKVVAPRATTIQKGCSMSEPIAGQ